jgi:Mn-containing catalase
MASSLSLEKVKKRSQAPEPVHGEASLETNGSPGIHLWASAGVSIQINGQGFPWQAVFIQSIGNILASS